MITGFIRVNFMIMCGFFYFQVNAQPAFQKIYGGNYNSTGDAIRQTSDGGFVITGYTAVPGGGSAPDGYIVRTDANGTMLWNKSFGGIDRDYPKAVQQAPDGGYIMAGFIQNNNTLKVQVYVVKMDSTGNLTWSRHLGSSMASSSSAHDVEATGDGGFVVAGSSKKLSNDYDGFLFKVNDLGTVIWGKHYGGTSHDLIYAMNSTSDGGFVLAGYSASFGLTNYDFYLIKTDSVGNVMWSKTYGDLNANIGISVKQTNDGGFIILGYTEGPGSSSRDMLVVKTDSLGNYLWNKVFGGPGYEMASAICQAPDQGYMITGYTQSFGAGLSDSYIIRTDSLGDSTWTKTVGLTGYDEAEDVIPDINGGFAITGGSTYAKAIIIKSDISGFTGCNETTVPTSVTSTTITEATHLTNVSNAYFGVIGYITSVGTMGTDSIVCTSVGLESLENFKLPARIYPNPASDFIFIEPGNILENGVYEILDMCLNSLFTGEFSDGLQTTISTRYLASGIYFVKIKTGSDERVSKLIIQH